MNKLESVLQSLTSNFYPCGSGMGVQTLVPLFELISKVREKAMKDRPQNPELIHEELGELALNALRDSSHEEWFRTAGEVEALITQLQLAFSVNTDDAITQNN